MVVDSNIPILATEVYKGNDVNPTSLCNWAYSYEAPNPARHYASLNIQPRPTPMGTPDLIMTLFQMNIDMS